MLLVQGCSTSRTVVIDEYGAIMIYSEKLKKWKKKLLQYRLVHNKSHSKLPGTDSGSPGKEASVKPPDIWYCPILTDGHL
jgi:hypothetical protein